MTIETNGRRAPTSYAPPLVSWEDFHDNFDEERPTEWVDGEIIEIMTWAQLGHHRKPIVFVNVRGFWDPMLALIDHMAAEGFIHTAHKVKPLVVDSPDAVVPAILAAASADAILARNLLARSGLSEAGMVERVYRARSLVRERIREGDTSVRRQATRPEP